MTYLSISVVFLGMWLALCGDLRLELSNKNKHLDSKGWDSNQIQISCEVVLHRILEVSVCDSSRQHLEGALRGRRRGGARGALGRCTGLRPPVPETPAARTATAISRTRLPLLTYSVRCEWLRPPSTSGASTPRAHMWVHPLHSVLLRVSCSLHLRWIVAAHVSTRRLPAGFSLTSIWCISEIIKCFVIKFFWTSLCFCDLFICSKIHHEEIKKKFV